MVLITCVGGLNFDWLSEYRWMGVDDAQAPKTKVMRSNGICLILITVFNARALENQRRLTMSYGSLAKRRPAKECWKSQKGRFLVHEL